MELKSITKMKNIKHLYVFILVLLGLNCRFSNCESNEERAQRFVDTYNELAEEFQKVIYNLTWAYQKDMTPERQEKMAKAEANYSMFNNIETEIAEGFSMKGLDPILKREISIIRKTTSPKNPKLAKQLSRSITTMSQKWGEGGICNKTDTSGKCPQQDFLPLIPNLLQVMSWSLNYDHRLIAWKGFRDSTGPKIKPHFEEYVKILNIGARQHNWTDVGQSWRSEYEMKEGELIKMMKDLWKDLKPTYKKLHGYIRFKLRQIFGPEHVNDKGPFPTHLLDMWGFDWSYMRFMVAPFPQTRDHQITAAMIKKKMTVIDMAKTAEKFYVSMGLEKMNNNFWKNSMFSHDPKKNVDCTVTAWDFSPGDYRIKMPCANVNENELLTVIHEMGHIQYDIMYSKQPYSFRNGANPAFHEAVGDSLTLSARTSSFLKAVGLMDQKYVEDEKSELNLLMTQALKNIAILPFALTIDFWRWKAFSEEIDKNHYNTEWWKLKREYQGVIPPVERTEKDFDPGANSHICNSTPYARYFIGGVLQFQFHEAMCRAAGHKGKLHRCSVFGSKKAGAKLREMLKLGKSKPWPEALEKLTGKRTIEAAPIIEYFKPLMDWLDQQEKDYGYTVGWDDENQ